MFFASILICLLVGASAGASFEYSLWKTGKECLPNSARLGRAALETNLTKQASVDDCKKACLARGGGLCNYFIFGKNDKAGKCWWEHDQACESGITEDDSYDIYTTHVVLEIARIWQTGKECLRNGADYETDLDKQASVDDCKKACLARGGNSCNYFIFGKNEKAGQCWWEHDQACQSGKTEDDKFDIYMVERPADCSHSRAACWEILSALGMLGHFDLFTVQHGETGCYAYRSGALKGAAFYGYVKGKEVQSEGELTALATGRYRLPGTHSCQGASQADCYSTQACSDIAKSLGLHFFLY